MRHVTFLFAGIFTLTMVAAAPCRAGSPDATCQKAVGKALAGCISKLGKAEYVCFKKTGASCAPADKKVVKALDKVDTLVTKKCLDAGNVDAAGYGPLSPSELVTYFQDACTREVDNIAERAYGGAGGDLLAAASAADAKCLLTAGKEAVKQLGKSLKAAGKCAGKSCGSDDVDKIEEKLKGYEEKASLKLTKKCSDLQSLVGLSPNDYAEEVSERIVSASASPCDPLDESHCLYPTTNDYFSSVDVTADTGHRLHFTIQAMPANTSSVHVDPTKWNEADGFSVGPMLLMNDTDFDLTQTGATPITDIATSLDSNAPVVLFDADTGAQQILWVERDTRGASLMEQAVITRVAANLDNDKHYIIAMRNLKDGDGNLLPASSTFTAYRDHEATPVFPVEARRAHMESLFDELESFGVTRSELYLAWDFTTQSITSTASRMLKMRDDTFDNILGPSGVPAFTVDSVTEPLNADIFRQIDGTFQVPLYLTAGGVPGSELRLGADGLPENQGDYFTAAYRCLIPYAATTGGAAPAVPARVALYGHGLLGSKNETSASHVQDMASEHDFVICGTDWTGFASADVPTVLAVLQDFSNFPKFIERQHQGILNFLVLGRLLQNTAGFATDPAFQVGGESVIDPSGLFYDGNSQGGIMGGVVAAFAQEITRFSLGVPGINYSTLLNRSTDFGAFYTVLSTKYPNGLDRTAILALAQILWDRMDPSGHVRHTLSDTYENTPAKKILYQVAYGDHQVAPVTVEVAARSNGASIYTPTLDPMKVVPEVTPYYGIPAIPSYPFDGSAMVVWDSGNPAPPTYNQPPPEITPMDPEWSDLSACAQAHDSDPHECPRRQPAARQQKSDFLQNGGAITDQCSGAPCLAPLP